MNGPSGLIKRQTLALLGGLPGALPQPPDAAQWAQIDAMAEQHRLCPLLFARARENPYWQVPPQILARWEEIHRESALSAMLHRAALRDLTEILDDAGIPFIALKGARLAWKDYPEPAQRPLRDIDLLVAEEMVEPAFACLIAAGLVMPDADEAARLAAAEHEKHLPPMWFARRDVQVELHTRLTDLPHKHGYLMPQLDSRVVMARAEAVLGPEYPRVPASDDMLAHLMIHALYNHRLDCGPLILADVFYLIKTGGINWPRFWQNARSQGWARGAMLLIQLTERRFGPVGVDLPGDVRAAPEAVLAAAEESMLQDFETRDHVEAMTDIFAARSLRAMGAALMARIRPGEAALVQEGDGESRAGRMTWLFRRLARLFARLGNGRAHREAMHATHMMRWLQS